MFKALTPAEFVESTTMEELNAQPKNAHYSRLYSCKHFRNRIIRLQQLCTLNNLDAILLISGKVFLGAKFKCRHGFQKRPRNDKVT